MDNKCRNGRIHTIKKGDTFYSLSRMYNVPLILILKANPGLDIYNLQIGEKVCIPIKCEITCNEVEEQEEKDDNIMAHIVANGESVKDIIEKHGMTPEEFVKMNNAEDILLKPGITVFVKIK